MSRALGLTREGWPKKCACMSVSIFGKKTIGFLKKPVGF
jgi:hypothetical protein